MARVRIIAAFAGTGKTTLSRRDPSRYIDLDSSAFAKERFPKNYINAILMACEDARYDDSKKEVFILLSTHKEVRDYLHAYGHEVELVYPHHSLKYDYLHRYRQRGSDPIAVNYLIKNWNNFIETLHRDTRYTRHQLKVNEFLSDLF